MEKFDTTHTTRFADLLVRREAELRELLGAQPATPADATREVTDFKDAATEQSQAAVDDVTRDHARHELDQVVQARRRLADHSYGRCLECGDAIDLRRLTALPATPYCTSCQGQHEHAPR